MGSGRSAKITALLQRLSPEDRAAANKFLERYDAAQIDEPSDEMDPEDRYRALVEFVGDKYR